MAVQHEWQSNGEWYDDQVGQEPLTSASIALHDV
jgi:hypothetical protein